MKIPNLFLALLTVLFITSCEKDNISSNEISPNESISISNTDLFMSSVALKPNFSTKSEGASPISFEAKNFNPDYDLPKAFTLNGVAFSDDGLYKDEVAGDGVYTSIKDGVISSKSNSGYIINKSFNYKTELINKGVSIGCSFTHDDCPEDGGFWDSDWGTGMGCFYLDSCSVTVEFF